MPAYLVGSSCDPLEGVARRPFDAVEGGELGVHKRERGGEKRREVGLGTGDDRVDERFGLLAHQRPEIVGEALNHGHVFFDRLDLRQIEPLPMKVGQDDFAPFVSQHSSGLGGDLLARGELPGICGAQELIVGHARP